MSTPAPVRRVQEAVDAAARAVAAQDRAALDEASDLLARTDPELQRVLLAGAVRVALERAHPAGLDSEVARDLLERCVRSGLAWLPDVEVPALVLAVTGALGMQDPDEEPELPAAQIAVHAVLLLAELGAGPEQAARDLDVAVAELTRAETVEMP
ncbi:hypothetical protein ACIB24_15990 [Spongisporangium articulatum]|uniref:Uncharacterized protein n=1 Tax=Spongisporangium articulatum TaxID=3362603 RepID=A0ABW8AQF0_9ACTN